MPPFSGADEPVGIGFGSDGSVGSTTSNEETVKKAGENPNEDKLVVANYSGFDPCGGFDVSSMFCSVPNPAIAVFKARTCYECGQNCGTFEGYHKKFILEKKVGEGSGLVETKVYFHEWCLRIHNWRIDHAEAFEPVLKDLMKYVHSVNIIARFVRRACERRRAKALEAREVVVPAKKEEKKRGSKRILSFLSKKNKSTIAPRSEVCEETSEEKVDDSADSSPFSEELKAASNPSTSSSEVAEKVSEEKVDESTESETKEVQKKSDTKRKSLGVRWMKVGRKEKALALGMGEVAEKAHVLNAIKINTFDETKIPKSTFWNRKYEI